MPTFSTKSLYQRIATSAASTLRFAWGATSTWTKASRAALPTRAKAPTSANEPLMSSPEIRFAFRGKWKARVPLQENMEVTRLKRIPLNGGRKSRPPTMNQWRANLLEKSDPYFRGWPQIYSETRDRRGVLPEFANFFGRVLPDLRGPLL